MWLANANINKLSWYSLSLFSKYQLSFLIYAFASQIKSEFPDINNKYRLSTETHQGLKKELIFKIRVFKSRSTISVPLDLHGWYKLPKFKKGWNIQISINTIYSRHHPNATEIMSKTTQLEAKTRRRVREMSGFSQELLIWSGPELNQILVCFSFLLVCQSWKICGTRSFSVDFWMCD